MNAILLLMVVGFVLAGVCLVAVITALVTVLVRKARKEAPAQPEETLSEEQAAEIVATNTLINH